MLLNELCRAAGTTRKAVAYYEEQGLISPRRQENGYREFTPEDAQRVRRITLLRRLELSVEEIRGVLDGPEPEEGWMGELASELVRLGRSIEEADDLPPLPAPPAWTESKQRHREALKKLALGQKSRGQSWQQTMW